MNRQGLTRLEALEQEIDPRRDLWPEVEARLGAAPAARRPRWQLPAALAAGVALIGVGILAGRTLQSSAPVPGATAQSAGLLPVSVQDADYRRTRTALLADLGKRLAELPPATQDMVGASLRTIQRSIEDLQRALGREPANALLQELLLDAYQDEMQILATVQESALAKQEI
ncbi:MAG: hypothetical protein R3E77_02360 [Steroidobacteraceae bacterium]